MDPSQTLRFTKIYLKNWRNFAEIEVELPRRAFLVGPNASGKTNFLDALRFVSELSTLGSGGFRQAVKRRGGFDSLYTKLSRREALITIRLTVGHDDHPAIFEYELTFTQDKDQSVPFIVSEVIRRYNEDILKKQVDEKVIDGRKVRTLEGPAAIRDVYGKTVLMEPKQSSNKLPTQSYLENEIWRSFFPDFADFLGSVRHFNVIPALVRHFNMNAANEDGYNDFIEQIASAPEEQQSSKLKQIQEVLRGAVPQFKELRVARGTFDEPHLYARYSNWKGNKTWENEAKFSDGTLRLIGLLWAMLDGAGPMLVEEPELSLHYGVVRYIPQMIDRLGYSSGRQAIVSTHSTDLLRDEGIELEEIILLTPGRQGTSIAAASSVEEIQTLVSNGFNLASIVQSITSPMDADEVAYFDPATPTTQEAVA